jgi:hypothetical protein
MPAGIPILNWSVSNSRSGGHVDSGPPTGKVCGEWRREGCAIDLPRARLDAGGLSAATAVAAPILAYAEFAAAVKNALRDANRPDLLARNPLPRDGMCNHGGSVGPQELRSLLCETVRTLFGNPRDETLRRVLELT